MPRGSRAVAVLRRLTGMARQPKKSAPSSRRSGRATTDRKADVNVHKRPADADIAKPDTDRPELSEHGQLSLTDAIKAVATGHARKPGAGAAPSPGAPSLTQ